MRAARAHAVSRDAAPSSRAMSRTISQPARRERRIVRPPSATIMRPAKIVAREERRNDPATRRAINARQKTIGRTTLLGTAANGWRIQA
ncbi:hypothetical protein F511_18021 [Dorcoceras hygrometricum]|uniref:Uncharacterized protein n=1 Tax=Dorcoceras hygrometricum TaxID=472368 RepID=A0A2Z7BM86_9LAMI|nr:hypothetical protein F511_18021 [Dorcoceras hygrometricum]